MKHMVVSLVIPLATCFCPYPGLADSKNNLPAGNPFQELSEMISVLAKRIAHLEKENVELKAKMACISGKSDAYDVYFDGCNVHVRNGAGATDSINGLGNLVIGYDEDWFGDENTPASSKTGSHNLVVGPGHTYTSFGGLVAGAANSVTAEDATVAGGKCISGGMLNRASGSRSSVSGGSWNIVYGNDSSISGGSQNQVSGVQSSIAGGQFNRIDGHSSSIGGGFANSVTGDVASIAGGHSNRASGDVSGISGGYDCEVTATRAWGVGGADISALGCVSTNLP
jgi:hypothetical protein